MGRLPTGPRLASRSVRQAERTAIVANGGLQRWPDSCRRLTALHLVHPTPYAPAAFCTAAIFPPMDGKAALTDFESTTITNVPTPVLCVLLSATHAGDEEAEHEKIPFYRGDSSAGIFGSMNEWEVQACLGIARLFHFQKCDKPPIKESTPR